MPTAPLGSKGIGTMDKAWTTPPPASPQFGAQAGRAATPQPPAECGARRAVAEHRPFQSRRLVRRAAWPTGPSNPIRRRLGRPGPRKGRCSIRDPSEPSFLNRAMFRSHTLEPVVRVRVEPSQSTSATTPPAWRTSSPALGSASDSVSATGAARSSFTNNISTTPRPRRMSTEAKPTRWLAK